MMKPSKHAIKAGVRRGRTEFMNSLRTPQDIAYYIFSAGIFLTVILLNRNSTIEGAGVSFATMALPGVLGMQIVIACALGLASALATEREDGTLLRAKSMPHGMTGYVSGQVVRCGLETIFSALIVLIPATILVEAVWSNGLLGVVHVLALLIVGLVATVPLGLIIGSIFKNPRSVGGWGMLVMGGLIWISGIFAPLVSMAAWIQGLAQVFPLYWLGLGMRSAMLPDGAASVEIGGSWRVLETFGVLGLWALAGLVLAPILLRRMARRESGSTVEARRQSALQRV